MFPVSGYDGGVVIHINCHVAETNVCLNIEKESVVKLGLTPSVDASYAPSTFADQYVLEYWLFIGILSSLLDA